MLFWFNRLHPASQILLIAVITNNVMSYFVMAICVLVGHEVQQPSSSRCSSQADMHPTSIVFFFAKKKIIILIILFRWTFLSFRLPIALADAIDGNGVESYKNICALDAQRHTNTNSFCLINFVKQKFMIACCNLHCTKPSTILCKWSERCTGLWNWRNDFSFESKCDEYKFTNRNVSNE